LLVLSEGVAASRTLVRDMAQKYRLRVRDTRLGHGQRGGPPSHRDRTLAVQMVDVAFQSLHDGVTTGTVVVDAQRHVSLYPDIIANLPPRRPDRQLYDYVNGLKMGVHYDR